MKDKTNHLYVDSTISHDVVNQFVYMVTPTSDTTFDWYVNLNGTADVKATFTAEGRKKSCIIKLEEIEKISSLHRKENEDNAHLIKNPIVFTFLHRLLLDKQGVLEKSEDLPEIVLSWEFRIDFETAKAFRKSGGNYLRANQWEDLTVEVRIS